MNTPYDRIRVVGYGEIMESVIHIRAKHTGRYLNADGSWSALRRDARNFLSAGEASNWCVQRRLVNVEIVVVRDELIWMRVPVSEEA